MTRPGPGPLRIACAAALLAGSGLGLALGGRPRLTEPIQPIAPAVGDRRVESARADVSEHMGAILELFRPDARITVLVRSPEGERVEGAHDFIMTNDEPDAVARIIARRWSGVRL